MGGARQLIDPERGSGTFLPGSSSDFPAFPVFDGKRPAVVSAGAKRSQTPAAKQIPKEWVHRMPEKSDKVGLLRDRLIGEMRVVFGADQRRIDHALSVLDNAETILEAETADPLTVKAAAILHDIGIHEAERKHGSPAGRFQEIEGPPIARAIMQTLGLDENTIDHVGRIVGSHHSARDIDTIEFRILWDADWLVNIPDEFPDASREKLQRLVARVFKTDKGRRLAQERFL